MGRAILLVVALAVLAAPIAQSDESQNQSLSSGDVGRVGPPAIDISDLSALIDYLYINFTPPRGMSVTLSRQ